MHRMKSDDGLNTTIYFVEDREFTVDEVVSLTGITHRAALNRLTSDETVEHLLRPKSTPKEVHRRPKEYVVEGMTLTVKDVMEQVGCGSTLAYHRLTTMDTLAEIFAPSAKHGRPLVTRVLDGKEYSTADIKRLRPNWSNNKCRDRLITSSTIEDVIRPTGAPRADEFVPRDTFTKIITDYNDEGDPMMNDIYPCDGCVMRSKCVDEELSCSDYAVYAREGQPENLDSTLREPNRREYLMLFDRTDRDFKTIDEDISSKSSNILDLLPKPANMLV